MKTLIALIVFSAAAIAQDKNVPPPPDKVPGMTSHAEMMAAKKLQAESKAVPSDTTKFAIRDAEAHVLAARLEAEKVFKQCSACLKAEFEYNAAAAAAQKVVMDALTATKCISAFDADLNCQIQPPAPEEKKADKPKK